MLGSSMYAIFIFTCGYGALRFTLDTVGSVVYDAAQINKKRAYLKHPYTKRNLRRPLISIIIPAYNAEKTLSDCIKNITKSNYHNYEIVIVDNGSTDRTKQLTRELIRTYTSHTIKLVSKRKATQLENIFDYNFRKKLSGELTVALLPDTKLDNNGLKRIVWHFAQSDTTTLSLNVRSMPYTSIMSVGGQLTDCLQAPTKKLNSILSAEYNLSLLNTVFRTQSITNNFMSSTLRTLQSRYADDVIIYTPARGSNVENNWLQSSIGQNKISNLLRHRKLLFRLNKSNWAFGCISLPMATLELIVAALLPILLTYFLWLAVYFKQPELFGLCWFIMSVATAFTIWTDTQTPIRHKLRLSLFVPIALTLFYAASTTNLIAGAIHYAAQMIAKTIKTMLKLTSAARTLAFDLLT